MAKQSKLSGHSPEIYSVIKPSNLSHQAVLKFSCIEELKPPGLDSNYINWKFVVGILLEPQKFFMFSIQQQLISALTPGLGTILPYAQ